jgi:hypothetical protein
MSTPSIAIPAVAVRAGPAEEVDRYEHVRQYSFAQILSVWAAAALPMGFLPGSSRRHSKTAFRCWRRSDSDA